MLENEVAGGLFSARSPGARRSQKEHFRFNSVSQHCSSLFGICLKILVWIFASSFFIVVVVVVVVLHLILSDLLQTHNWLVICYSRVAQSCRVIIVHTICSGAPPRLSMRISLSAAPWNRRGWEYQTGGKRQAHKSSCSSLTSHWACSQVHGPLFHKYGSITQSSLVSGLQAGLSRIWTFIYILY